MYLHIFYSLCFIAKTRMDGLEENLGKEIYPNPYINEDTSFCNNVGNN